MRKFIYIFLSLAIVFSNTQTAYAAASTWYPQSVVVTGGTAIINAAKQGFRSTISHAPAVASVAKEVVKVGTGAAVIYAVNELLGEGIAWVMDPANNRIKYTVPVPSDGSFVGYQGRSFATALEAAEHNCSALNRGAFVKWKYGNPPSPSYTSTTVVCVNGEAGAVSYSSENLTEDKFIPLSDVTNKVISNAASGHAPSQEIIKTAATNDVFSGSLDSKLDDNAVPSDAPFDPTRPNDPASTPFDASSLIAAMQSVMSAINNMSASIKAKMETMLVELGLMNAETNKVINESVDRIIENDNVKVGEIVAAIEAIEGNTLDGQVINDAVDKVIAEGKTNTADIVAAIEAIEGNTLDGQVINDAVDKVIANDDANAQATQDVISNSIDDAIAESHVDADTVADAVTDGATATQDAIREQTDSLTKTDPDTGEKSLALPDFCSWASSICEFTDWVKTEPQTPPDDGDIEVEKPNETMHVGILERLYIDMPAQCPPDPLLEFMGAKIPFPMSVFCQFASMMKPLILLFAYIKGLSIIGNGLT